jgi:hypothetical protein
MKKTLISLAIFVVVIIAGYGIYKQIKQKRQAQVAQQNTNALGKKKPEPSGTIAKAIPKSFIPDQTKVLESYEIPYQGMTQSSVSLESSSDIKTVYDYYKKTFLNNYTITADNYTAKLATLYAYDKLSNKQVNVVIRRDSNLPKTYILLSYLDKTITTNTSK